MSHEAIADLFSEWNKNDQASYLLEITMDILRKKEGEHYLLNLILDKAENKGTGSWSSITALDLGMPATMITSAVFARYLSSFKAVREQLARPMDIENNTVIPLDLNLLEKAYRFARIINHHQGFEVMLKASEVNDWHLNLSEIARIWTNGCIIRSQFMEDCISYFKEANTLLLHPELFKLLTASELEIAESIQFAIKNRVPLDSFWSAYHYWISMTTKNLPANLIQAQRDYFGAHTYRRIDAPLSEFFHTNWQEP